MEIEVKSLNKFGKGVSIQQSVKSVEKQNEETFCSLMDRLSDCFVHSNKLMEIGIDTTAYENQFYGIIEELIALHYGGIQAELMLWWVYEYPQVGKKTPIHLINEEGEKTLIKNIKQLYKYIIKMEK